MPDVMHGCRCCAANVSIDGLNLGVGDGAAVSDVPVLALRASGAAEVMLFDLA